MECVRRFKGKAVKLSALIALTALLPAASAPNKYDVLAQVLMPFANVFAQQTKNPNRAMQLAMRLESLTDLPEALAGTRAEFSLEYPDKLRLRGPVLGESLTLCRRGQELWVSPGSKVDALLRKLPPEDREFQLAPFELPVPEKQLVFLPALFRVTDAGSEMLDAELCRVLEVQLAPEVERSLKAAGWSSRLWVRANGAPARLVVKKADWQMAVRFERVEFSKSLLAATWQPDASEAADVRKLTPAQYQQLMTLRVK